MRDRSTYATILRFLRQQPWLLRIARIGCIAALCAYFAFALTFVALRYLLLPYVADYRGDIERLLSTAIALPVSISRIEAHWYGLRPNLALFGFTVRDSQGRPALALDRVEAEVAWSSLLYLGLRLERLEIAGPTLSVRRDPGGHIFVAGLPLARESERGGFANWLLAQHRIVVRDAQINWQDEQRAAPALELRRVNFQLRNDGARHRFGLSAEPPAALAARLDVRGDFRGAGDEAPQDWSGQAYVELDYADLAVWRHWVDYPIELEAGSGGVRLWLGVAQAQANSFSADLVAANVRTRLGPDLPMLTLGQVTGRISAARRSDGFSMGAKGLMLTTDDGIKIEPSDFQLNWFDAQDAAPARAELAANGLDLDALARLAGYLPVDAVLRQRLAAAAPRGKLFDLALSWRVAQQALAGFTLRTRFADLGMNAQGLLPGFQGMSGSIEGSDGGGVLKLASRAARVDLPAVFAEAQVPLHVLGGEVTWKQGKAGLELGLAAVNFENDDAAGVAEGRYWARAGEAGSIDLSARLTRANGSAVWRYIPLGVSSAVRDWLQESIRAGTSSAASLRLKGDLQGFPFASGDGIFEVRGTFSAAQLRYAEAWPQIDGISGDLAFVGPRMTIRANKGSIHGVGISEVTAEIRDLGAADAVIAIAGRASGATGDFLRFIEASPVGERIEHFTEDMSATGNGRLDLKLGMPLRHIADTRVDGVFQVANNRLTPHPGAPTLTELGGRLEFTGSSLKADHLRANLYGMPVTAEVKTRDDGLVLLNAHGALNIAALRRQFDHPLLEHLSGTSAWHAAARLRGKSADVVVESRLVGVSSSLPEPFNKSALEPLPLRFERRLLPATLRTGALEQLDLSLGSSVAARLQRRIDVVAADAAGFERGMIAAGVPLVLPEKGLLVAVREKKIDVDFWRGLLESASPSGGLAISQLDLKAAELTIFGRRINDLALLATAREGGWHAQLKGREVSGELDWHGTGAGRLSGHLQELAVNAAAPGAGGSYRPEELPGLDIEIDRFSMRDKLFGHLKINADNRKGQWEAKLDIDNEDGKLSGSGSWQSAQDPPLTRMEIALSAKSVEKLLARLGYPNAVRRGQANLEAKLAWNGSPLSIDYASLDGTLSIVASAGQFNKLEPGAGRVLGILSLQSLPRRITLDFRDIFSEGFAFDSIAGQVAVAHGMMSSKDLRIQGPAAKILMSGSVDLPRETQNLVVHVQPAIGESLSVGAILMAHPAIGALTYLIQKLLRDPLDQAFAYEYAVTGTWADPKVERLKAPVLRDSTKGERE